MGRRKLDLSALGWRRTENCGGDVRRPTAVKARVKSADMVVHVAASKAAPVITLPVRIAIGGRSGGREQSATGHVHIIGCDVRL